MEKILQSIWQNSSWHIGSTSQVLVFAVGIPIKFEYHQGCDVIGHCETSHINMSFKLLYHKMYKLFNYQNSQMLYIKVVWLYQRHLTSSSWWQSGITGDETLPTAKPNSRDVLPTCQDKFDHVIYDHTVENKLLLLCQFKWYNTKLIKFLGI